MADNLKPVVYIFVNQGLHMTTGKAAAQAAHAIAIAFARSDKTVLDLWNESVHRTILVMKARDAEHLKNMQQYLKERNIRTHLVIDEGVNEIDPHVPTALATDILDRDDAVAKQTLSSFELYRDQIKFSVEVER